MSNESVQNKLTRVRPPRVKITYDVEVGDAKETKELPMMLGVVGNFAGHAADKQGKLKDRSFTQVDRDNINDAMRSITPSLQIKVSDKLSNTEHQQLGLSLEFKQLSDFTPDAIVQQVPPLQKLLEVRTRLSDLRNKMVGNDKLEEALDQLVRDTEKLSTLPINKPSHGGA
jgi:type VI secretion system protein ImpB